MCSYADSCERGGINQSGERFHRTRGGFGWQVHWFRVHKKANSCQKRIRFQKINGFVWIGPKAVELGLLVILFLTSVLSLVLDMI